MSSGISKALESSTFLLPSMALILLYTVSGHIGFESPFEWSIHNHVDMQEPRVAKTDTTKQNDPEVKAVLDKMAAAGINRPSTVADVRKAYLFYPKLSGTPEHVFHIEDRQIPGPAGNITVRVYSPTPTSGLPILVFFHGGGVLAGDPRTPPKNPPSRAQTLTMRPPFFPFITFPA